MNSLKRFMEGRYGGDQLSFALLIFSFLLTLIADLTGLPVLAYMGYISLCISIFRMLSKNIEKRRMENYKFAILMSPAYSWLKKTQNRIRKSKTDRCFKCPGCKTELWVPKGKGRIVITCPICKTEFRERT